MDGDDYFWLDVALGPIQLVVMDANTNMEHAQLPHERREEDLPDAKQIGSEWTGNADHPAIQEARAFAAGLRAELIERGSSRVTLLSDEELTELLIWVLWKLGQEKRLRPERPTAQRDIWLPRLEEELIARDPETPRGGA